MTTTEKHMTYITFLRSTAAGLIAASVLSGSPGFAQVARTTPAPPTNSGSAAVDAKVTSPAQAPDYRLAPGDKLRIDVYKDEQLSQSVQVRPDGKITMPFIGDVTVSGLKPLDLRDHLTTALKDFVNNPVVTVVVVEATAPTAYIVGEVNHPGAVTIQGKMTILQALAIAGGLKDFANAKGIRILRTNEGRVETIPFNYKAALKGTGDEVYIQAGDTVVVPD